MATWTQVENLGSHTVLFHYAVDADLVDKKIYVTKPVAFSPQVFVYVVATDTLTQLSNFLNLIAGPVFFEDELYAINDNGTNVDILRYSGVGTTWNVVHSFDPYVGGGFRADLGRTGTHLIATYFEDIFAGTNVNEVVYSEDGSSWSNGTIDNSAPFNIEPTAQLHIRNRTNPTLGLYVVESDLTDISSPFRARVLKWNGNTTTLETVAYYTYDGATYVGDEWVTDYLFSDIVHWKSESDYQYALTLGTWLNASDATIRPNRSIGFSTISTGDDVSGANRLFYQMATPPTWDAGEIIAANATIDDFDYCILMQDGSPFIVAQKSNNTRYIYARDEIIPDFPDSGDNGKRLWIFKGNGIEWSSRGLKTSG